MNWNTLQGNWNQAKGQVKTQWGKLTDDDLTRVEGHKDRLVGILQQRYGLATDKAEEQIERFLRESDTAEGSHNGVQSVKDVVEKGKDMLDRGVEKGKEIVTEGKEMVQKGKDYVQTTSMSQMATDLKDVISKHPVYSTVIGLGLGYMIGRMMMGNNSRG